MVFALLSELREKLDHGGSKRLHHLRSGKQYAAIIEPVKIFFGS